MGQYPSLPVFEFNSWSESMLRVSNENAGQCSDLEIAVAIDNTIGCEDFWHGHPLKRQVAALELVTAQYRAKLARQDAERI